MKSISHTNAFELDQPIADVFPLFSPEGEKAWVPGWDYENVMGEAELCEDYVFVTRSHDHATTDAIWLVKRYVPEAWLIQFYRVEPGVKVGVVTVQCSKMDESKTQVQVTYAYTPLSDKGQKFLDGFTSEYFKQYIEEWKELLLKYFESAD